MTALQTAAQQALEALDAYSWEQVDAARTALRAALAEPQGPDPWGAGYEAGYVAGMAELNRAQKMRDAGYTRRPTLREMAEPVQEPDDEVCDGSRGALCIHQDPNECNRERDCPAFAAALAEPVQEPVACLIGTRGSAFDSPTTKRAYTYAEQPGNVAACRLGLACNAAASQSAGDSIDRGLGLLQELQKQGFGVFDLGAEFASPSQPPAEPVQGTAFDRWWDNALDGPTPVAPISKETARWIWNAAKAEPVQEPVHGSEMRRCPRCWEPMFPPQRKPLTEEEIGIICASLGFAQISPVEVTRAVEAAHGIKEGT